VCHSDVHLHEGHFDMGGGVKLPLAQKPPLVLGHEIEGVVVRAGPDAKGVKAGDRVVAYPWIGCGDCPACARGEENYCPKPQNLGVQRFGGYADHCLVPDAKYLIATGNVPQGLAAAYMCSGLTAFGALKKVERAGRGDPIAIVGYGGLGMMAHAFARHLYPEAPILVADVAPAKRAAAAKEGARAYDPSEAKAVAQLIADSGDGAAAALDFVGSESSLKFATGAIRRGGRVVVVGLFGGAWSTPIPMFPFRAMAIMGSYVGTLDDAKEIMALARAGRIAPIPIEERPLAAANKALEDLRDGKIVGRVVLTP
jgi:D-arabinose 1-dehydrogenase-like Zn-dependent alcohol dehydrogenase